MANRRIFRHGERVFVNAKFPNNIYINGDPVENYLIFTTSHDGRSGVKILFSPIRVVCQNILNAAIDTSINYVSFRHTFSVHRNIDIASKILGICKQKTDKQDEIYDKLGKLKMSDTEAGETFANVVLSEAEQKKKTATGHVLMQIVNRN